MPVTRSAVARSSKVHDEQESSSTTLDKQHDANGEKMLPKTVDEVKELHTEEENHLKTKTALLLLFTIFACSVSALAFVYYSFPHLEK